MGLFEVLRDSSFGNRVAEDETKDLANYFVETHQWRKIYSGEADVVYGPKGSGKSALYALLHERSKPLLGRQIAFITAENPRGAVVFKKVEQDPPTTELEFVALWKLYSLSLLGLLFKRSGAESADAREVVRYLEEANLISVDWNLQAVLDNAYRYVKAILRPEAIQGEVKLDPTSGMPIGLVGKISLGEPKVAGAHGIQTLDSLISKANSALDSKGLKAWIAFDRLDVAFAENSQLEENALRALFKTYLDFLEFENIRLKVFLRTDIWRRITRSGFREASHITRTVTLTWEPNDLLNLLVRRIIKNPAIQKFYSTTPEDLNSLEDKRSFFYKVFPDQIDAGEKRLRSLEWLQSRTSDGTQTTAPRELIHLLNATRDEQIRAIEQGEDPPDTPNLFAPSSAKRALTEVSKVRLEQTLFAEYPTIKPSIEALWQEKTSQSSDSLAVIWKKSTKEAGQIASRLVEIGFFEARGSKDDPEYWVPFLYRPALEMVQGKATD